MKFTFPSLGLLLSVACADAGDVATIQARLAAIEADSASVGRYQIVNGVPSMARNIMLIDTQTGQTWVVCSTDDKTLPTNTNWCEMTRFDADPAAP